VDALLERTFQAEQRHFWFRGFKRFVAPLLEQAVEGVRDPRLLDAGCGTGANLRFLAGYGTPFGLELFWRGLAFGRQRGLTRLSQGSVTALPFATGSMDVVLSFDVLYCLHPPDERAAVSEMHRVLRPGGRLHFWEHVRADRPRLARVQRVADATIWPLVGGGCHTHRDTVAAVEAAGFALERVERFSFPESGPTMPASPHALGTARKEPA